MDFDFGDVLTRAWKITWNHKVLWVISVLPFLTMFLLLPFWLILLLQKNVDFNAISTWRENPIYSMIRMQAVFGVVILPLMALIQGFSLTYIKSAMMRTYLRLTRSQLSSPLLPGTVEAAA